MSSIGLAPDFLWFFGSNFTLKNKELAYKVNEPFVPMIENERLLKMVGDTVRHRCRSKARLTRGESPGNVPTKMVGDTGFEPVTPSV